MVLHQMTTMLTLSNFSESPQFINVDGGSAKHNKQGLLGVTEATVTMVMNVLSAMSMKKCNYSKL